MRAWILAATVLAIACGSAPPPASAPAEGVAPYPSPAPTSCTDAAAILRGPVTSANNDAGPAREAAIAHACTRDTWAPELLACIGQSRAPQSCLDRLPPKLAASYQAELATWLTKYSPSDGGPDDGALTGSIGTSCETAGDNVEHYSDTVVDERDWSLAERKAAVVQSCNRNSWGEAAKRCLAMATSPPVGVLYCVQAESGSDALATELDGIDKDAAKIAAVRRTPAAMTCAKAAAGYYGGKQWAAKLRGAAGAKAIAGARAGMEKACALGAWGDGVRACLATGAIGDRCFDGAPADVHGEVWANIDVAGMFTWRRECQELAVVAARIAACDKLGDARRDALAQEVYELARKPGAKSELRCAAIFDVDEKIAEAESCK